MGPWKFDQLCCSLLPLLPALALPFRFNDLHPPFIISVPPVERSQPEAPHMCQAGRVTVFQNFRENRKNVLKTNGNNKVFVPLPFRFFLANSLRPNLSPTFSSGLLSSILVFLLVSALVCSKIFFLPQICTSCISPLRIGSRLRPQEIMNHTSIVNCWDPLSRLTNRLAAKQPHDQQLKAYRTLSESMKV